MVLRHLMTSMAMSAAAVGTTGARLAQRCRWGHTRRARWRQSGTPLLLMSQSAQTHAWQVGDPAHSAVLPRAWQTTRDMRTPLRWPRSNRMARRPVGSLAIAVAPGESDGELPVSAPGAAVPGS
jgi:hypothetical protein